MRSVRYVMMAATGLSLLALSVVQATEIKLEVSECAPIGRKPGVVTSGVPFEKGVLKDPSSLALVVNGQPQPAQWTKTVPWEDGSVRWALLDTQVDVPASGRVELVVSDSGKNPVPAAPVRVEDGPDAVRIATGGLTLFLTKKKPGLFESLRVDGKELVTSAGRGLVIMKEGGGEALAGAPTQVNVEYAGPLRAVVCLKGKFPDLHEGLLGYTARVSVFAGQKHVKVHLWLENAGADGQGEAKPEWFTFDGMAVELGLGLGKELTARCEGVESKGGMRVLQLCNKGLKAPFYTDKNFAYTITGPGGELKKGERTDGVLEVSGESGKLTAAVRDFWQNYEKAMELDAGKLRLWLWPVEGQWPRPGKNLEHEQLRRLRGIHRDKLYLLAGSVHKGHEFILDCSGRPAEQTRAELAAPLFARASAAYYAATGAVPGFFSPPETGSGNRECDFRLKSWKRMSRIAADPDDRSSLFQARREYQQFTIGYFGDSSQWYGWMDFGDLSVPGKGQMSLLGDWPLVMLFEYLRGGDATSLQLATEMVRHRIDIDQYWSDRDPPEGNRVQRKVVWPAYHADGRSSGTGLGMTRTAGMVLWYMLTGEPKAREAALRCAQGLAEAWPILSEKRVYGGGPKDDMGANACGIDSFCAAYDLTGDRKWLEDALKLFNGNVMEKSKKYGPHLHAAGKGQIFGQSYKGEDADYCHAIEALCLLHLRSQDAGVLKLLKEACEKPLPADSYFKAPMFMAGLFGYTGVATGKPEYVKMGAELFSQGFPDSKNPPVFLPDNTTWAHDAVMTLRSGYPVQYAFWKAAGKR